MLRSRCRPAALARIAALLLCCASLASGGVLYREDFEDREPGRPPPLWEEEGGDEAIPRLIVVAEPDAENRAWGFAPRVRERPIDRPGESDPGARAILAELSFPLDAVEIGGRMRAGPRSAAAILLLDPADPARAIAAFHLETGSVRADRGETAALSTGGWIRFAIAADGPLDLAASFWPEGGPRPPAPQFRSPRPPAGTFRLGVLASGPSVLFDDLVVTVADPEGEPPSGESDPPRIAIFESGAPLADGSLWGREIRPTIVVEDESGFVVATTLDGAPFESGSPVGAEGPHVLRVEAEDAHGNRALALVRFTLDRSPPALALAEPAGAICTGAGSIELRGTASDPHLERVDLASPAGEIAALVDSAAGTWSATLPLPAAGAFTLLIRASDVLGHRAIHPLPIRVDRSAPAIAITAGGAPAIDGMIAAHPLSFLVAVRDDDPAVALELLLDGELYENASLVEREGSSLLVAAAVDCAGNRAEKRIGFTIDVTAPELGPFDPPIDSLVGSAPASIRGSVSDDAISVSIAGTPLAAVVAQGAFDLPGAPFDEGLNRHRLRAVDRAGNTAEIEYRLTLRTRPPSIDILERGVPLENGSLFNREVRPEIVTDDPEAEVEATLDGNAFTSGSVVSGEGTHLVRARASDALGHAATAEASFTIDRTPPAVAIISPLPGIVTARAIEVRGTATGAVAVSVNGVPAALAGPEFTATVAIDEGENRIVALARDEARNVGRAEVLVTLEPASGGIVLTFPADGAVTNRASTRVSGRVLSPSTTESVAIGSTPVVFDPAGSFTLDALPLAEGPNPITATARATTGRTSSASVTLIADRSPPRLRILESGVPLADQARLPAAAQLAIELSDDGGIASSATTIDGVAVVMPVTVAAPGGHTILAVAVDTAGNETRLERTFFVGGTAGGCRLEGFHPAAGSVIAAGTTLLTGRTGGAAGVTVDGVAATVSNGSFCATVGLPREGENEIKISCTDPEGNPFGVPATLALVRATQLPSVAIEEPPEGSVVTAETTRLAGVAGAGVVAVTVNGVEAAIAAGDPNAARSFAVDGVRLTPGLNVLLARARTASGKQALASRRVVHLPDAPSLSVTSPSAGAVVGNATAPVSGTWRGIDPSTLAIAGSAAAPIVSRLGDGEGSFLFPSVALAPGSNVVAVGGRDDAGREASAVLTLVRDDAAPFIAIEEPRDHAIFGADAAGGVAVHGTALAAPGATIEIGGAPAMIDAAESLTPSKSAYSFSGTIPLAALGPTAVVARVTEPSGAGAVHAIAARRLADPPSVLETFPEPFAASVDPGAMIVVLFSSPMDRVALAGAFRLESAAGSPVSGTLRIERDALTFAPAAPLGEGGEYTIAIAAAATDVAGVPLPAPYASSFRVTGTAPAGAPSLDPFPLKFCGPTLVVSGSARPGARVRLEVGALSLAAPADGAGAFRFELPLSGPSGHHLVRVAEIGGDGTLSPAASACVMIDCGGLRVDSASFDRSINRLTIALSEPADPASVTTGAGGSIVIRLGDGRIVGGTASLIAPDAIHVDPAEDLTRRSFALEVTAALRSAAGTALALPFTQEFPFDDEAPPPGDGSGFVSGEIYDAGTGRPLAGATIAIASPLHAFGAVEAMQSMQLSMQLSMQQSMQHEVETTATAAVTDARGRYTLRLAEGAHVLEVRGEGTTTAWRQIIVPSGGGVTPIDIRLAKLGATATADGSAMLLGDGGDAVATNASLEIPAGGVAAGSKVTLTSVGAQSLAGLLPPGWSPLGSAEIALEPAGTLTATLSFEVRADEIAAAAQTLSLVRYDSGRDEWRVAIPVVSIEGGRAIAPISAPGAWALVHPDRAPLAEPPPPTAGSILAGAPDGCAPDPCPPLTALGFTLDPAVVLPSGSSVATLTLDGAIPFPSGTAVQAWIAEELQLADGSTLLDAPFATDLLLHRDLRGDPARAIFRIAPSPRAAEVLLQVGWERLRVLPYPGRLARGTLVGREGGRIPSDAEVVVEIAAGATNETIRAAASSLGPGDLAAFHVPGFRVLGGLALELERASDAPAPDLDGDGVPDHAGIELLEPARVTFHAGSSALPRAGAQVIVAEVLEATPFGRVVRLAARAVDVTPEGSAALLFTTDRIDRAILPLDGVVREGTYLFLAATTPIAFATGRVRRGAGAPLLAGALVTAAEIGVADLTRASALFAIPVPAAPAAPFALIARHPLFGEGEPHRAGSAPAEGSVVVIGELILAPQPPRIVATTPASGAAGVPLTTTIGVRFDRALDPSSITADSIVVSSAPTDARVEGAAAADGAAALVWSLSPESSLAAGRRYEVAVAGSIRASSGAPLGQPFAFSFTTLEALESGEVRPERISITIPAEGMSTIRGTAGALPSGWQALAVRRGIDFAVRHQATAVADGSFAFAAGGCGATGAGGGRVGGSGAGDGVASAGGGRVGGAGGGAVCGDAISIADLIDLHALDPAGALRAIVPLTPFISEDGRAFYSTPANPTRFTTTDGLTITVPPSAFDTHTLVTAAPEQKTALATVPHLDAELGWSASVRLDLVCGASPCTARDRIDLEIPAVDADPGKTYLLALLGLSTRGPRLMIVDTLRVENGRFTTAPATQEQSGAIHVTATPTDDDVKSNLLGVKHPGIYSVVDLRVPAGSSLGWGIIEGLQGTIDLFWDLFASLYASHLYMTEAKGKIAIPVLTGLPFTVTGVDPATGLDAFEKVYVPLPVGDPGAGFIVESPLADLQGPYPIFATPFRIELLDLEVEKVTIESVRNFRVRLDGGLVKVTDGATPLAPDVSVALLNVSRGVLDATRGNGLVVPGSPGDRIVLLVEERNASPDTPLSVVFNEPIDLGGATTEAEVDAFLRTRFTLHTIVGSGPPEDVTPLVRFRADSGGRRVLVERDGSLHRGASYRLHLSKEIADRSGPGGAAGLRIAEVRVGAEIEGGLQGDLVLELTSRAPGGELAGFDIGSGAVRDLARSGNLMFVAALDGGVLAWDVADPASLGAGSQPVGLVPGTIDAWWSVAADRHQRVFAAGLGNVFGVLRTFRLEQFLPAPGSAAPAIVQQPVGSGMVSWVPGYSSSLPLASAVVLSDRAEAIPRKLQVLSQDVEGEGLILEEFKTGSGESVTKIADLSGGFEELTVSIAHDPALAYLVQRVTVENLDRGMRWSADARPGAPAVLENVVARANDRLRVVRNQRTWAAVSLFGFGVGIFDLNAMESNDAASKPDGYESIREQVLMTRATLEESACSHPGPESGAIPDLAFTPEAAILPDPASPFLRVYALDATRGILDLKITPAALGGSSSLPFCARNPMGLLFRSKGEAPPDDPRLHAMRAKFEQIAGRPPFGRFNGIATHRWVVEAADNRPLVAGGAMGRRGTVAFERAERDYLLVAGNEYGLLVVEAPRTGFLGSHHLADVVWIPAGAAAVRAIPGADLAAVVDGEGHLLLVDLARIDERWSAGGQLIDSGALFSTLEAALSDAGPEGTGLADPRIVWRSGGPVGSGTLAPLVDPGTGLVFAGRLLGRAMKIVAALDPRLRVVVDLAGDGLLREVGGIIPLGVSQQGGPPAAAPAGSRASASKSLFPAASPNRSAASCASPSRASAFPAFRREGSGRLPQLRPPPPPSPPRLELTRFGGHLRMMVRSPRWHDTRRISAADGAAGEKRAVPGGVEPQLFPYVYLSSQADSVERN